MSHGHLLAEDSIIHDLRPLRKFVSSKYVFERKS